MTTDVLSAPIKQLVQGTGPYPISDPYSATTEIIVLVRKGTAGDWTPLTLDVEYTVSPRASETTGDVTLSEVVAQRYHEGQLLVQRQTQVEQGYKGQSGPRDKGLEAQLDRSIRAIQELSEAQKRSLQIREGDPLIPLLVDIPLPGSAMIARADGKGWENGAQVQTRAQAEDLLQQAAKFKDQAQVASVVIQHTAETKSDAIAALSTYLDGAGVLVWEDESQGGGSHIYRKLTGALNYQGKFARGTDVDAVTTRLSETAFDDWTAAKAAVDAAAAKGPSAAAIIGRKPVDGAFFGLIDSDTVNQRQKLQDAINDASQAGINALDLGSAWIRTDGPIYCYYDATDNPNFQDYEAATPFAIKGVGMLGRQFFDQQIKNGATVIELTDTTSDGLLFGDGNNLSGNRASHLANVSMIGQTTGSMIVWDYVPQSSTLRDLWVANYGAGNGVRVRSTWMNTFENLDIWGRAPDGVGGAGIGFWLDNGAGTVGGGMNRFSQITSSYFDIANRFCNPFNASNTQQRVNEMQCIQGRHSNEGLHFGHGLNGVLSNSWLEHNAVCDMRVSDSCAGVSIDGLYTGSPLATEGTVILGRATGAATEKGFDFFRLVNCPLLRAPTGGGGIVKYATAKAPPVEISHTRFNDNGGVAILVESGDHGNITLGPAVDFSDMPSEGRMLATSTFAPRWDFARGSVEGVRTIGAGTISLTGLYVLPETFLCSTVSGASTIQLPNDPGTFLGWRRKTTFQKYQTANDLVLDAGAGNTIKGAQTYTIAAGTPYKAITLVPTKVSSGAAFRWDVISET